MTTSHDPLLVFWDIDHTLINIGGVSRDIYTRAFELVTGRTMGVLADMTGRTERAIITDTLSLNDIDAPEEIFSDFYEALGTAADHLRQYMVEKGTRLPGTREAIRSLARAGAIQSVVTGNIHRIAIAKLEAFDLAEDIDFQIGGYGDDGSDRSELVRLARKRSEEKHGHRFAGYRTIVIGDTPHDIKGAHDAGVVAIGVATGSSTVAELREAGADATLPDLADGTAFSEAIRKVSGID